MTPFIKKSLAVWLAVAVPGCTSVFMVSGVGLPERDTVTTTTPFANAAAGVINLGATHGGTIRASVQSSVGRWQTQAAAATTSQITAYVYTLKTAAADTATGGLSTAVSLNAPGDAVVDGLGNVIVCDTGNDQVRMICTAPGTSYGITMTAGNTYTLAGGGTAAAPGFGDGLIGTGAQLNKPQGLALDGAGNLYIADTGNHRIRVLCKTPATVFGVVMAAAGFLYPLAGDTAGNTAAVSDNANGDGGPIGAVACKFSAPKGMAFDTTGNLFIADSGTNRIRMIALGAASTLNANGGAPLTANSVYAVAGTGSAPRGGTNGDGGPARSGSLNNPSSLAFNANGDLFVADTGNHRIRAVSLNNAAIFGVAPGLAFNLITVAGDGTGNGSGSSGDLAVATSARLSSPRKIAFSTNATKDLLIADTGNHRIRAIAGANGNMAYNVTLTTANAIYNLAGTGTAGTPTNGGQAASTALSGPVGFAVGAATLLSVDTGNNQVRAIAGSGTISALAGTGTTTGLAVGVPQTLATATVAFTGVPDGTYVLEVDAKAGATSIAQGGPRTSRMRATVTGGVTTYTLGASGLAVTVPLNDATGATSTVTPTSPDLAATQWGTSLALAIGGPVLGTFLSQSTAAYKWFGLADGAYTAWTFARGATGFATPARPSAVTVSASGVTVNNPAVTLSSQLTQIVGGGNDLGDGELATAATTNRGGGGGLGQPQAIALDTVANGGNIFMTDFDRKVIRMVCKTSGTYFNQIMTANKIYTIAGRGTANGVEVGTDDTNGQVARQTFLNPGVGLAVDSLGNVYTSDRTNNRVRVIARTTANVFGVNGNGILTVGNIYNLAGDAVGNTSGTAGPSATVANNGNNAAAGTCNLNRPTGLNFDPAGNLYICDYDHYQVRMIPKANIPGGLWRANGNGALLANFIYAVAGGGGNGTSPDGVFALNTGVLAQPDAVVFDPNGNMVINDQSNHRVRVVAKTAGGTLFGVALTTAGMIYNLVGDATNNPGVTRGAVPGTAKLNQPNGIAFDSQGNLFIATQLLNCVMVVAAGAGPVLGVTPGANTLAVVFGTFGSGGNIGEGLAGTASKLTFPYGLAVGANDNLIVADTSNARIRMLAATTGTYFGTSVTANLNKTLAGYPPTSLAQVGYGVPATNTYVKNASGVAYDNAAVSNVYYADRDLRWIFMACNTTGSYFGISMTSGNVYAIAGDRTGALTADALPALTTTVNSPGELALDSAGNLYVSDGNRVRVVANDTVNVLGVNGSAPMVVGYIYAVASQDGAIAGSSGNGGPATAALLNGPKGLALDSVGNLFIADTNNSVVRMVANSTATVFNVNAGGALTRGRIYLAAGTVGSAGNVGDGTAALGARLQSPAGVAVDRGGNLYISDTGNNRIRCVPAVSGTFRGNAVTAFSIYNLAGDLAAGAGATGDAGLATAARLSGPMGIAIDGGANLYVVDNGKIRMVAAADNRIYTVVGNVVNAPGASNITGNGTAATSGTVAFINLQNVAVDAAGRLALAQSTSIRTVF
ncbi:MAG: hypothetical protein H7338_00980 [Candidatus Sericytochromatia bacterium]|nr:hypothetical protein [Candidatus Sericytochromatia bacterium]